MTEKDESPVLVAEQAFRPGQEVTVVGPAPTGPFSAVFEDDGDTGYLYGLDSSLTEQPILDALHIYNASAVVDSHKDSVAQIVWSSDGLRVALFINDYPHAVFDFGKRRGYCRTGFPPPAKTFSSEGHDWSEEALEFLRA
jgi:hypothetical protein